MKILWLYKFDGRYHFDHWFHVDLVYHIRKAGHECYAYGPQIHTEYGDITLQNYRPEITMEELHKRFQFDVVICCTKSRMFEDYRPPLVPPPAPERRVGCWLPKDFSSWKGPKVVMEEDYHYETDNNWYKDMNISLVLQRHKSSVKRFFDNNAQGIKCQWHPLSVDQETFKPDNRVRINKICMAASVVHEIYKGRRLLIEKLTPLGMMENHMEQRKVEGAYVECLKSYVSHGNCSSIYDITPAKMFEIMSSGSVLLTDRKDTYGLKELFYDGSYVNYEWDGSNIPEVGKKILNEPEFVKEVTTKGRQCILDRHTHAIRIGEMVEIFQKEL